MRSEVNPMRSIPILLDGDPGHDDAIAWMLAKASPTAGDPGRDLGQREPDH